MLRDWLGDLSLDAFRATHLGCQAWARPGVALGQTPLFDWSALGRILEHGDLDLIAVARGQFLDVPPPRSLDAARAMLATGAGFVIRRAERHDEALARFAESVTRDLPGHAHIQLFVTPGSTHGFAWHYDAEEVFITQTAGVKDYYFRANTVTTEAPRAVCHDFSRFRDETSPLQTARLLAGDVLYLPARWWHMAKCVEDSLSISLGIQPHAHA
jgi:50S ribosomal protein L16 3-hydroxylase